MLITLSCLTASASQMKSLVVDRCGSLGSCKLQIFFFLIFTTIITIIIRMEVVKQNIWILAGPHIHGAWVTAWRWAAGTNQKERSVYRERGKQDHEEACLSFELHALSWGCTQGPQAWGRYQYGEHRMSLTLNFISAEASQYSVYHFQCWWPWKNWYDWEVISKHII